MNDYGGVALEPHNVYTLDTSGFSEAVAERASAAMSNSTGKSSKSIVVDGVELTVARSSRSLRRPPTSVNQPLIGRFRFVQTDLGSDDPRGPALRRYFDSTAKKSKQWSTARRGQRATMVQYPPTGCST